MQKKIIALAIAAAFSAPAFADTTAYGIADLAVAHISADGLKGDTQVLSGGLSTSRVGIKSVEDLGNGMKAVVNVEYKIDAATSQTGTGTAAAGNSTLSARQQMLALAGDFGTVAGGFLQTAAYDWAVKYNPVEGSTVSPLGNVTTGKFLIGSVALGARAQRALAYISNDISGVKFAVNYTTGLDGGNDFATSALAAEQKKSTAYLLSVDYTGVPNLAVGFVYAHATLGSGYAGIGAFTGGAALAALNTTSTLSPSEFALGASYDFGVAKVFATFQSLSTGTNTALAASASNKAESIGATIPAGPGAVVVSYAKSSIDTKLGANLGASGETAAYLWNLSKDDTVYFAYSKQSQDSATNAYSVANGLVANTSAPTIPPTNYAVGSGSSLIAVGLRKKF